MFMKAESRIQEIEVRRTKAVSASYSGFWILTPEFRFYGGQTARKQATLAIACFLPQLVSPVKGGQARLAV
jgi:hypothetical protein